MVRMLLPFSLLSAAAAMQTADVQPHLDVDGMKSMMLSIGASAKKGGITEAQTIAIQSLLNTVESELVPALEADKNASQSALDTALAAVNQCNTDKTTWINGELAGLHTNVSTDLGIHNSCRDWENVTLTNLTAHCKTLNEQVCSWTICDVPNFANGDSDEVDIYMCCLDTFFNDNKPTYYTARTACIDATTLHHQQTAECDADQETFETSFCDRETNIQNYCSTYQTCRCNTESAFASIKSDTEALETIFQTQFVALKHLLCYGSAILANHTDLTSCDAVGDDCEADYTDCPQVTYVDPDDAYECTQPHSNYPCQQNFHDEFYAQYDDSCTPVDDCIPCADTNVQGNTFGGAISCA